MDCRRVKAFVKILACWDTVKIQSQHLVPFLGKLNSIFVINHGNHEKLSSMCEIDIFILQARDSRIMHESLQVYYVVLLRICYLIILQILMVTYSL